MKKHKYNAVATEVDGIRFPSKAEARRWSQLVVLQKSGEITRLERQPRFACAVNGTKVCDYVADFRYFDTRSGKKVIEDVKGVQTDVFRLKKKLVEAIYQGTEIKIVK